MPGIENTFRDTLVALQARRMALTAQLEELDTLIAGLQRLIARGAEPETAPPPPEPEPEPEPVPLPAPPPTPYANMQIVDAARHYLGTRDTPVTTREIAEALVAGGLRTRSRKLVSTVGTILRRAAAAGNGFRRDEESCWYLERGSG